MNAVKMPPLFAMVTAIIGILLSVLVFLYFQKEENDHVKEEILRLTEVHKRALSQEVNLNFEAVLGIKSLFETSRAITRENFRLFTRQTLDRYNSIQALEWIPRVPVVKREYYETWAHDDGFPEFAIREKRDGKMVKAGERVEYFPVYMVEPFAANKKAFGYDLASNAKRLAAIEAARDSGKMVVTATIDLIRETARQKGFLVFLPIYSGAAETLAERRKNLRGFVLGVFGGGDIFLRSMEGLALNHKNANWSLYDMTDGETVLFETEGDRFAEYEVRLDLDVGGRTWQIRGTPSRNFVEYQRNAQPYLVLIFGIALTGLLVFFLHKESIKKEEIERIVVERTNELKEVFSDKEAARIQLVQVEKLISLGSMVAGVAHEINTPVGTAVTNVSELKERTMAFQAKLENGGISKNDMTNFLEDARDFSHMAQENLLRAAQLIRSFKQVAVDQSSEEEREFDLGKHIEATVTTMHHEFKRTSIVIKVDCPAHTIINGLPGAYSQIVSNLALNSLIHGFDEGNEAGEIKIVIEQDPGAHELVMTYADNGKGMNEDLQAKIFDPFFTTRRDEGGSGLGMHVVHSLVTQTLGGTIDLTASIGQGVIFKMNIPVRKNIQAGA